MEILFSPFILRMSYHLPVKLCGPPSSLHRSGKCYSHGPFTLPVDVDGEEEKRPSGFKAGHQKPSHQPTNSLKNRESKRGGKEKKGPQQCLKCLLGEFLEELSSGSFICVSLCFFLLALVSSAFFLLLACWSGTAAEFFISQSKARDGPSTNASVVSTSEHLSTKGEFGDSPISGFWFGVFATQFVIRIRNSFIYAAALNRKRTGDGVRRFFASL